MVSRLFPALLKFWRTRRGLSQLELALEADVSTRHVSFLESGRSKPSEEMALRLLAILAVPLRDQNDALLAAGFAPRFAEPELEQVAPSIEQAIARMVEQQEPYPLTVLTPDSTIVRSNRAATALFGVFLAEPERLPSPPDMFTLVFSPQLMRPFILDWETLARGMLSRLHRDSLMRTGDERLRRRLDEVLAWPGVPASWRHPDFSTPPTPMVTVRLQRGALRLGFLTTITVFSAPQQVTLEELRIESCFPLDEETRRVCETKDPEALRAMTR